MTLPAFGHLMIAILWTLPVISWGYSAGRCRQEGNQPWADAFTALYIMAAFPAGLAWYDFCRAITGLLQ